MNILYRYLGYILILSTIFRIIPIIAALFYGESIVSFVVSITVSMVLGLACIWYGKKNNASGTLESLSLPQAFMLVAVTFLILPLIGSISFLPSLDYNITNAVFESISGYTTTGMTMYSTVDSLPQSLLLWRAVTQWIGGIGIILVFLFIMSRLYFSGKNETTQIEETSSLYQSQGLSQKIEPSLQRSCTNILIIYGSYTLLGIILLIISGMTVFESISLTFTALSTGGFIVTDSLQASNIQLAILSLLMILGSISFITHNKLLQKKFKDFFCSKEMNLFLWFLIAGIGLTLFVYNDVRVVLFELISAFTTTGYSISTISALPHLFLMILITGMVIGGTVASTSGGIKVDRIYSLFIMVPWMLRKLMAPRHAIIPLRIHKKIVEEKDQFIVIVFVLIYGLLLFSGTIFFLLLGYSFFDAVFQIVSALGTVGLQTIDLISLPLLGKVILMVSMLFGRLEIFPLLFLMKRILQFPRFKYRW